MIENDWTRDVEAVQDRMTTMSSRTALTFIALAALISLAGCQTSRQAPLPKLIGHRVHLTGQFNGPGKIADFILLPNGAQIYLTGKPDTANVRIEYGTPATADGILHHYVAPPLTGPEANNDLYAKGLPEYYFIEDAIVRPTH